MVGETLSSLERAWLQNRVTGSTNQKPLNQLRKEYYTAQIGGSFNTLNEYRKRWLAKVLIDNGGTPSDTRSESTLLKEILSRLGYPISTSLSANYQTLYRRYSP